MSAVLRSVSYRIPFRHAITTAAGRITERRGFWVLAQDVEGRLGLGEAAPMPEIGTETMEEASAALRSGATESAPAARAGIELALFDLEGKQNGTRVAERFNPRPAESVPVNALLVGEDPDTLVGDAAAAIGAGFTTLKVKVGALGREADERRIAALREIAGPAIRIRIDANARWEIEEAAEILRRWERYEIEYAEQPVARGLAELRSKCGIRIAADESVRSSHDAIRLIRRRAADIVVLKPMAIGGMRAGWEIARMARDAGIGVVVTSILDTAVGIAGALHLAAALPESDLAHGLATADLLVPNPARGLPIPRGGRMPLPAGPGSGVQLTDWEAFTA